MQKIVRRKTVFSWQSEASDLVQAVALRLLKWRKKHQEKSEKMSPDEWQSFAAKTAYNEINRHYSDNSKIKVVSLDSAQECTEEIVEGQTEAEVFLRVLEVWQEICNLSLRQRRALLFSSQELVVYFLKIGITDEELAEKLSLTIDEWARVKENTAFDGYSDRQNYKGKRQSKKRRSDCAIQLKKPGTKPARNCGG